MTTRTKPSVHWTRFPALAFPHVDWSNHDDSHRAVMSIFARELTGERDERRSASAILFRVDAVENMPVITVQSEVAPVFLPQDAKTMIVPEHAWHLQDNDQVRFRLAINPIRRNRRAKSTIVVPTEEVPEWLTPRFAGCLTNIEIFNHARDTFSSKATKTGARRLLVIDTIDGTATVSDSSTFDEIRRNGVGRSKSFGCGLITAQKIS